MAFGVDGQQMGMDQCISKRRFGSHRDGFTSFIFLFSSSSSLFSSQAGNFPFL